MKEIIPLNDFDYMSSAIGNAFFSGLTLKELWECVSIVGDGKSFDVAIDITLKLKELIDRK